MEIFQSIKLWVLLLFLSFAMTSYGQNEIAYNTDMYEGNIYNHALSMCLNYEKEYFGLDWDTLLFHEYPNITIRFLSQQPANAKVLVLDYNSAGHYLKRHGKQYFFRIYPLAYSYDDGLFYVSVERSKYSAKRRFFHLFSRNKYRLFSSGGATYKIYYKFENNQFIFVEVRQ